MKVSFDYMPAKYWNIKTRIEYLQRKIIVHSIIYYELDYNCISDSDFDRLSKQLVELQNSNRDILDKTQYGYVLSDFDGSTGFYIYDGLKDRDREYLTKIAKHVIRLHNSGWSLS